MKQIITLIQFILGFVIGVFILAGGAVGAGYYFLSQMASAPPKPTFNEKTTASTETPEPKNNQTEEKKTEEKKTEEKTDKPSPKATSTPIPSPTPTPVKEEKLPQGAYKARVTWNSGLTVRAEPSMSGSRSGGVNYNDQIVILEEKEGWQKIRTSSGLEGWVKSGNTAKSN